MALDRGLSLSISEKRYPGADQPVLGKLALDIAAGSFVALLGPSGVGKSTLLRLIAGIDSDYSGAILWNGTPIATQPPPGFVFQDARLLPWLTAADNVRAADASLTKTAASRLLADLGLPNIADNYPHQLSGGMQRRVALARAFATNPSLLLLDEPFVSLDQSLADDLQQVIAHWVKASGATVVMVTHRPEDAANLADRALVLSCRPAQVIADIALPIPRETRTLDNRAHYTATLETAATSAS